MADAVKYGAAGAAAGSAFGPVGTAIGGIGGAILGGANDLFGKSTGDIEWYLNQFPGQLTEEQKNEARAKATASAGGNPNAAGQQALAGDLLAQRQKFQAGFDSAQPRVAPQQAGITLGPAAQTAAPQPILQQRAEFNANPMFATQAAAAPVARTTVAGPSTFQAATAGAPALAQNGAATAGAVAQPNFATGGTANAATVDTTGGFRPQQSAAIDTLQAAANGTAPSAAQEALKQQTARNIATQFALRATARGNNVGMAERAAADNVASINQQAIGQGAELTAQEQATARGQLGGALQGARGQDIQAQGINANNVTDVSKFNTGLGADLSKFNTGLQAQTSQFNAGTLNQSAEAQAAREQAARATNAGAQNTVNSQQAAIGAGEASQGAALGTDVSKFNAGMETDLQKFQRQAFDQNQQFNALQGNDLAKFATGLGANVGMANTTAANDITKAQGQIGQQIGANNLGAQVDFARMDDAQKAAYLQFILGTQGQSVDVARNVQGAYTADQARADQNQDRTLSALAGIAGAAATWNKPKAA